MLKIIELKDAETAIGNAVLDCGNHELARLYATVFSDRVKNAWYNEHEDRIEAEAYNE